MAVLQSSYSERITGPLSAGTPGDMIEALIVTRKSETVAAIPFGVAIGQGAGDYGGVALPAAATNFIGVSVRDVAKAAGDSDAYQRYENMGVLIEGDIWVVADGIVAAGNNVTYSTATGKFGTIAADGTHILLVGARWLTSAADGANALLRLTAQQAGS